MENKMATPPGTAFSTAKNVVSQCDDQTLRSTVETLVIQFDQKMFEQLLSGGSTSPLNVHKYRKIFLVKASLANAWKLISVEMNKALYEPIPASCGVKYTPS